ncbi:MAG: His/Gly/Thr/Pro-type tRNA ligase C-terminal domain-containing protein, partial [Emergencia sp.]
LMLMDEKGIEIPEPEPLKAFIAVMGEEAKAFGLKLLRDLRNRGVKAEMDTLARNIKGQFKYADRLNAQYTVVIGDNELAEGKVAIKEMATSQQKQVSLDDLLEELAK